MATTQKKTTGGKRTASSSGKRSGSGSSAARKSGGRGKSAPQPKPIRREVGAVVCLLLAFFAAFGYFHIQAVFIDLFCSLLKGLFGYGFWLAPPMLVVASYILAFHRGRPVRLRLWCALLTPLVMGAILHLFLFQGEFSFQWSAIGGLWEQGQAMTSGGVVSGLLSEGLAFIFSSIGAGLILILCQIIIDLHQKSPKEYLLLRAHSPEQHFLHLVRDHFHSLDAGLSLPGQFEAHDPLIRLIRLS